MRIPKPWLGAVAALCSFGAFPLGAQELEPGAYSVSPPGVNFLVLTNNFSGGDLTFDPALPVEDARATINTTIVA